MVTNNFFRNVDKDYKKLEHVLEKINQLQEDQLLIAERGLLEIDPYIRKLRSLVKTLQFTSIAEEVYFFKNLKPKFVSWYLYYNQILNIKTQQPRSGKKALKKYYENYIKKINVLEDKDLEFYNYYKREATYLDHKYFVRNAYDLKIKLPEQLYSLDDGFTTLYDHQVATIIANEKVVNFLLLQIKELDGLDINTSKIVTELKWTVSKVSLIELIYALHHSKCFNAGVLELSQTIKVFENCLDVDLSSFHKVISEIKSRKNTRTKFLQHLQDNINQMFLDADQ